MACIGRNSQRSYVNTYNGVVCYILDETRKEDFVVYEDVDQLLTVREVAQQLRVDDTTVRRWIKNGVLEAITLPHRGARQAYRVRRSTLDALLSSSTQQTLSQ
jgi:excisionase family DNA binding protein